MTSQTSLSLSDALEALSPSDASYARRFVDELLAAAIAVGASDLHIQPVADGLWLRWRIDGVLQDIGTFSAGETSDVATRLKVLASLLTYRSDTPQEGRLTPDENSPAEITARNVEMRLSTFPTLHGERAVVRFFAADARYDQLDELGLPDEALTELQHLLAETSGAILVTGPAGSGKTTTCYAMLRHLVQAASGGRNMVSIEDPVEVAVSGVAQAQVQPSAGFDLAAGLKAMLRQDPEVIMVSEIRDPQTASLSLGASLTGHLVIGSFHAGSAAGAISRLSDMGVQPYVLRSGVLAIVCQRLVRRLCACAHPCTNDEERLGLPVASAKTPVGCADCLHTGYRGRVMIAELLPARRGELGAAILSGADADRLEQLASQAGMVTRWQRAIEAIETGVTSPAEVRRVLGFDDPWTQGAST